MTAISIIIGLVLFMVVTFIKAVIVTSTKKEWVKKLTRNLHLSCTIAIIIATMTVFVY